MGKNRSVIIILDTLRKDIADRYIWPVVRKYGFHNYGKTVSTSPWTIPSHISILTGLYPLHHGVHLRKNVQTPNTLFLPKVLRKILVHKQLGHPSVLLSANILVSNYYGYDFDIYYDATTIQAIPKKARFLTEKDIEKLKRLKSHYENKIREAFYILTSGEIGLLLRATLTWFAYKAVAISFKLFHPKWPKDMGGKKIVEYVKDRKNNLERAGFILINLMEAHEPYTVLEVSKKAWKKNYKEHAKYLAEIVDELLGYFTEKDKLIITSDHGQLLGEYNLYGHGFYLYDELVRVPLYTNFEINNPNNWFSLKNIYHLVLDKPVPKEPATLSEYFGIFPHDPDLTPKHRIAVYYKNYKGIFNVDEWKWECWKTYNGEKEVPEEAKKEMTKIVVRHLKTAVAKDKVKKLVPKKLAPKKGASF